MPKGKFFAVSLLCLSLAIYLSLELSAHAGDSCPINIPTSPGNVNICTRTPITWNDFISDDTIARNSSCTVAITDTTGRGGPYYWSVSGNGFSLKESKTKTTQNILLSNGTACGTATVTVTDCSGKEAAKGYVRCTSGKWVLIYSCGAGVSGCSWYGSIRGKYKYDASWCYKTHYVISDTCPEACPSDPGCTTPLWRDCYHGTCFCNWARTWEWGCQ